jgi:hypothetical protein
MDRICDVFVVYVNIWKVGAVICKYARKSIFHTNIIQNLLISNMKNVLTVYRSRDSSFGIGTDHELDDRGVGVRVPLESRIFFSPRRPILLWDPPSLLSNGCWG